MVDRPASVSARFRLEWIVPLEPGLLTHVMLFDQTNSTHSPLASGHGGDEADALLDLWTTLIERNGSSIDAISFVADAYMRRTGRMPERPVA
jgi:hypothetical protein